MKWYIHVNQHKIRSNIKSDDKEPVIAIKRGKRGRSNYVDSCIIPDGSRILYQPDSPILSCGARLVIECPEEPQIG